MAVTYGFFNSVNGDRKYNADQMSEYFRGIVSQGVFQHLDSGLAVSAGTGLSVSVAAGRAIIQDRWIQNSAALNLTISAASETYGRKDAVVIRLDKSSRAISITVKTGTPAASPVAPSMTRNATTYEMALAYVNVAAGASSVTVTDKRSDSSVCGWAAVAQATSGEVDAMLNAMKTGFDGVEYDSPVEMVQRCDEKIKNLFAGKRTSFSPILFSSYYYYKAASYASLGETYNQPIDCVFDYSAYNNATVGSSSTYGFVYEIADYLRFDKTQTPIDITLIIKSETARNLTITLSTATNWNTNSHHIQSALVHVNVGLNIIPVTLTPAGKYDETATKYQYLIVRESTNESTTADMTVYMFGSKSIGDLLKIENTTINNIVFSKRLSFNPFLFDNYIFYKGSNNSKNGANFAPFVEAVTDYTTYNEAEAGSESSYAFGYRIAENFRPDKSATAISGTLIIKSATARNCTVYLSTSSNWNTATQHVQKAAISVSIGVNVIPITFVPDGNYGTTLTKYSYLIINESSNKSNTGDMVVWYFGDRSVGDALSLKSEREFDYDIQFWGDSLTAGAGGSGTSYPQVCALSLGGLSYRNNGVGGESAATIAARMGANAFIVPAGNINGNYALDSFVDDFGVSIRPLRQGTSDALNPIKINGIECAMSITQESSTDPNATYTISGYTGDAVPYNSYIETAGSHFTSDITVIFIGQNGPSDLEQRMAYIDSMIAKAATKKYVVMTLSSGTTAIRSAEEATLLKKYGGNLFMTRKMLVDFGMDIEGLTPTAQDEADIAEGKIPESLRNDTVHLNAYGYHALGVMLANKIRSLGYISD